MNESIRSIRANVRRMKSFRAHCAHRWVKWVNSDEGSCSLSIVVVAAYFANTAMEDRQQLEHKHTLMRSREMKMLLKLKHNWNLERIWMVRVLRPLHNIPFYFIISSAPQMRQPISFMCTAFGCELMGMNDRQRRRSTTWILRRKIDAASHCRLLGHPLFSSTIRKCDDSTRSRDLPMASMLRIS